MPDFGVKLTDGDRLGWAAAVAESVPGAAVRAVHRIGGGTTAQAFAIDTTGGEVVVKCYRRWRCEAVRFEWKRLHFAQRVQVPVPRPLALDAEGSWFGKPALAMSRIPGHLNVDPTDLDAWLRQLAQALVAVHTADTTGADGPLLRRSAIETWRPPTLSRPSPLVDQAVAAIERNVSGVTWQPVLTHGDFHPGNSLWLHDRLIGIADWTESRLGPAASDLAYCRIDVALLLGCAAADRLTHHYASAMGAIPPDLAVFDLIWGVDAYRKKARILSAHREQGRAATPDQFTSRATDFLRRALADLGRS